MNKTDWSNKVEGLKAALDVLAWRAAEPDWFEAMRRHRFEAEKRPQPRSKYRVHIAGPITGMPGYNIKAFRDAEDHLLDIGYKVFNPLNPGPRYPDYYLDAPRHEHLRRDIIELTQCDCVALLPGYVGSFAETEVALALGMPVFHLREGLCFKRNAGVKKEVSKCGAFRRPSIWYSRGL